jgi:exocyst complex component 8
MKDSPDVLNAFKIIKHPEMTIYRSETLEEKRSLLCVIQNLTDEILSKKRVEKKSKEVKVAVKAVVVETDKRKKKVEKDDLAPSDFRWLLELPDELDVLIAHRDFDQAVSCVAKARRILNSAKGETQRIQILRSSINSRIFMLSKLVALDLASPVATKDQVQGDIDKLLRLGLGDQARDIFLTARSSTIRSRLRHLKFNGDLPVYISEFSELTFRLIRNTCDWYSGSFHDTEMASGFMKWLQQEIKCFTETLRRQVFSSKQGIRHLPKSSPSLQSVY